MEVSEDLTRLGFRNDNGKWSRTAPRTGARTVVIEGSRGRTLEVKATTETDLHAISRLEYILTWSQLETPQNAWDAVTADCPRSFCLSSSGRRLRLDWGCCFLPNTVWMTSSPLNSCQLDARPRY